MFAIDRTATEIGYLTSLLAEATKRLTEIVDNAPGDVVHLVPGGMEDLDATLRTAALVISTLGNASKALNPPDDSVFAWNSPEERVEGSRNLVGFATEYAAKL
jgi:hypothetical protein